MSLSIKEYFALAGSSFSNDDARIIGPVLQEIAADGDITPDAVVQAAHSSNSPLRRYFEWDDKKAANEFRIVQAKDIIQSVRVRFVSDGKEYATRAYNVVVKKETQLLPRETSVDELPPSPFEQLLEGLRALDAWRLQYSHLDVHRRFGEILVPLLNQISEFREDCVVKRTATAVDPGFALQKLIDWKDQFVEPLQVTSLYSEHVGYMNDAIESAWDTYAKIKGGRNSRLSVIEQENEQLRDRIDYLERMVSGGNEILPPELGLTATEARVVIALLSRDILTKDALMNALYADRPNEVPEQKIVDVLVCKIRPKLEPFGIQIDTIWGSGYAMPAESKTELRGVIEARKAAAA